MRVIARLDVKNQYVIKGIHLEGLRKVGNPNELAETYYQNGIDEIIFMDAVASLYDRNNLFDVIKQASKEVFVPIVIGGGIRTLDDIEEALNAGADKVAINTGGIKDPALLKKAVQKYGSQCIVASIESKKIQDSWECYVDTGREKTNIKVMDWIEKICEIGCGELMLTSIDAEGTQKGFETELIEKVNKAIDIPLIVSGGMGKLDHLKAITDMNPQVSAVAFASVLHYSKLTIPEIKSTLHELGQEVRHV